MRFIDEARVFVHAGKGGNGAIAFLREKYRPMGGPAGGDGGHGGSVIFEVNEGMSTLLDFKYQPRLIARDGEGGRGKQQYGKGASDLIVRVPPGTLVIDDASGEVLADLVMPNERKVIAQGGEGGKGNIHFATSTRRSPRIATPGTAGEERWVRLELRLVAEVGLVGLPNAGKSTLLRALTAARPKVAPYPFTTITPNLGRVMLSDEEAFSIADIPGLIEGAHLGQGLGIRFLRHVSRTHALVYVLDGSGTPAEDFAIVRAELEAFDAELPSRPSIVALNKMDLVAKADVEDLTHRVERATHLTVIPISADKNTGLEPLVEAVAEQLRKVETQKTEAEACPS